MRFKTLPYDQVLAPYINQIVYLEKTSSDLFVNQVLPTGLAYLNFLYNDNSFFGYPQKEVYVPRGCYIHGQMENVNVTVKINPGAEDAVQCITVELKALALRQMLGMEAHELTDRFFLLDDILGDEVSEIHEQVGETPGIDHKHKLILAYLKQKMLHKPLVRTYAEGALQEIYRSGGNVSLQEVARKYQISDRHLEKSFKKEIGLSPKFYARLVRFKRAARLMISQPQLSQSEVAFRCGYYDVSHLHRDCLKFSGFRPGALSGLPLEFTKIILQSF